MEAEMVSDEAVNGQAGVPTDPVIVQSITVEVMTDGTMNIRAKPPLPQWAILGLVATMQRRLGG